MINTLLIIICLLTKEDIMLILTRKLNDEIIIDGNIVVKVIGISENQIKIGVTAPKEVNILRGEIYQKIKEETQTASKRSIEKPLNLKSLKINKFGDN